MKKYFLVRVGGKLKEGTLRECQQWFVMYRTVHESKGLGGRSMLEFDGAVYRVTVAEKIEESTVKMSGHFSYNARFWRKDIKGSRVSIL